MHFLVSFIWEKFVMKLELAQKQLSKTRRICSLIVPIYYFILVHEICKRCHLILIYCDLCMHCMLFICFKCSSCVFFENLYIMTFFKTKRCFEHYCGKVKLSKTSCENFSGIRFNITI